MKKFCLLLFLWILCSCVSQREIAFSSLQIGDLIFVEARQENLSGAINRVTQTSEHENFDHIGILEILDEGMFVLHASPKLGSVRQPFQEFYQSNLKNQQNMVVYRLRKEFGNAVPSAIGKAKTMLGKPYNSTYVLNEEQYYCSDLIERAFRSHGIFEHIPMNFKNPKTGEIDDFWKSFYKNFGIAVPQDEPGTNPNQLAASAKLKRLGKLNENFIFSSDEIENYKKRMGLIRIE